MRPHMDTAGIPSRRRLRTRRDDAVSPRTARPAQVGREGRCSSHTVHSGIRAVQDSQRGQAGTCRPEEPSAPPGGRERTWSAQMVIWPTLTLIGFLVLTGLVIA